MIHLRSITPDDIAAVKQWPPYHGDFEQMDYALREHGWLDEFRDRTDTWIFAAESNNWLIAFSLLSVTAEKNAEFRIALHPDWTGKGLGRAIALATLAAGFQQRNLENIHLIVRRNNPRAAKLYERIGFVRIGQSVHTIRGEAVEFVDMDMSRERYNLHGREERT